jgi:RluA family pseudouridine synthase
MSKEVPILEYRVEIDQRERIDRYLFRVSQVLPSRAQARKSIRRGEVLLNGEAVESSRFVQAGDCIQILASRRSPPRLYEREIPVVAEDDWMAVVEKPPGLPTNGNKHRTLEHALPFNLSPSPLPDALPQPRPVHRLDGRTGGLLLVAKTAGAHADLGRQFEKRLVKKRYRALCVGRLEGEGNIELPIEGRAASSRFRVVSHTRALRSEWVSTVDLWPLSGRTHQLRIHMASLGTPILGDDLYGIEGMILKGKGLYLKAQEIGFCHPGTRDEAHFRLPPPRRFAAFCEREARRWDRYRT